MSNTHPLLNSAAGKLGSAMGQIKLDNSLSPTDFQKIRTDVESARIDLNMFNDMNRDPTGLAELLGRTIVFMDRTLQKLDTSPNLL
jgi:hypothetical protein